MLYVASPILHLTRLALYLTGTVHFTIDFLIPWKYNTISEGMMSLDNVRKKILKLSHKQFKQLCKKIAAGMGFLMAKEYTAAGLPLAFRETLVSGKPW